MPLMFCLTQTALRSFLKIIGVLDVA